MNLGLQYPIFGAEIQCPHCRQMIPALTLTDTYLCPRHGAFEADPKTGELTHLQSGRHWRCWKNEWYRQHTHPDGIRFEIHEALDRLYTQGYRATRVIIASRYKDLISGCLEQPSDLRDSATGVGRSDGDDHNYARLYGLPVEFSPETEAEECWEVINFDLEKEVGTPPRYPYYRLFE